MKMQDARNIMRQKAGYRVHFEKRVRGMLESDFFPDRDEPPIVDVEDAWRLAAKWADADPKVYVNVYVINGFDWVPVDNYDARKLNRHPPRPDDAVDDLVVTATDAKLGHE